jgi:hypothetical protein
MYIKLPQSIGAIGRPTVMLLVAPRCDRHRGQRTSLIGFRRSGFLATAVVCRIAPKQRGAAADSYGDDDDDDNDGDERPTRRRSSSVTSLLPGCYHYDRLLIVVTDYDTVLQN